MEHSEIFTNMREFIKSNRLGVLATISAGKKIPQAAWVYYVHDSSYHIYIGIGKNSQKLHNLQADPHIAFVVGQEIEPKTIQIEGTAQIVTDIAKEEELVVLYAENANKNTSDVLPPLHHLTENSEICYIELRITHFSFSDFSQPEKQFLSGTGEDWYK